LVLEFNYLLLQLDGQGVQNQAEGLEFRLFFINILSIKEILNVLVDAVEVLAKALVHPPKGLAHLDHLLLDALSVLLRLLLVSLFENFLSALGQFIVADLLKISYFDVVVELFLRIDLVEESAHELVLLELDPGVFVLFALVAVDVVGGLKRLFAVVL